MSAKNSILEKIKGDGYRLTIVRRAMVEIFCGERCLLSSAEITARLAKLRIAADRTTVYRELCFLMDKNIIKKIQLADGKIYYETAAGHHHHLICTKCNDVQEIILDKHLEQQERRIYAKKKFKVAFHSLEFYGLCGRCVAIGTDNS